MANGSSAKLVLVTTVKMESQVGEVKLSTLSHSQILLCGGGGCSHRDVSHAFVKRSYVDETGEFQDKSAKSS